MSVVVFNSTSGPAANFMAPSPRVKNLQGGVLGVVDNGKTNSDTVLTETLHRWAEQIVDQVASTWLEGKADT